MKSDPRVDAYIAKAAPFAQPILTRIREIAHAALPEGEEGIKWGMPHFMLGGKNVAGMAAFKAHCAFLVHGEDGQGAKEGMGGNGKIAALDDLPHREEMIASIAAAAERVANRGSASTSARRTPKPELPVPDDLAAALEQRPAAKAVFADFAPSYRRDYIEWITGAKREATRASRLAQAIEWIAEGKRRNWKYENC